MLVAQQAAQQHNSSTHALCLPLPAPAYCACLHLQVDEVKGIMMQNVEQVLVRGERLDVLVDRTDDLRDQVGWLVPGCTQEGERRSVGRGGMGEAAGGSRQAESRVSRTQLLSCVSHDSSCPSWVRQAGRQTLS
jgi:hypothetical protein